MSTGYDQMLATWLERGLLFGLDIELTGRCPLACRHCYQEKTPFAELSTDTWRRLFAQARELGAIRLALTGGELMLRSDLPDVLTAARENRFRLFVKTSGYGATPAKLAALADAQPANVDVSFYAHEATVHDAVTGVLGSFDQALRAVRHLTRSAVPVRAVYTPLAGFADDVEKTRDGLLALGVGAVSVNRFSASLCRRPEQAALAPSETADRERVRRQAPRRRPCAPEALEASPVCGAATWSVLVRPDGTVQPCHAIPLAAGTITRQSLADIWHHSPVLQRFRRLRWRDLPGCRGCNHKATCDFCPGEALALTGDERQPVPRFCREAAWREE